MAAPSLQVVVTQKDESTVAVALVGEARLDVEAAAFQLDRVVAHRPQAIIVDCTKLTFLSSIGMSLLVNLRRAARAANGTATLVGLQPQVKQAMAHARLLELFQIVDAPPADAPAAAEANSNTL